MRILLAHNDYGKFSGEENAVQEMVRVLESRGHSIIRFQRSSAEIGNSLPKKMHALLAGIYSPGSRRSIQKILKNESPDIVQVQNLYPFLSPSILLACKDNSVPVVMRCPNYRLFCPTGLHLRQGQVCEKCLGGREWNCITGNCEGNIFKSTGYAARNAFARMTGMIRNNVTVFIVLSEFQKQRFINGGIPQERISILPNISPAINVPENAAPGDTVTFVGRVSVEKGINNFLGAARQSPDIQFCVAGGMDEMLDIQNDAPINVEFTGFLSGTDLDTLFERSRVLVFPSIWFEGFPNVIAKAMAHGKVVVASRIGAIPEIVDDGVTGLLFKPGDTDDLAEKINHLWSRPDLCHEMGRAALAKARKEYSEERYYSLLSGIYEKAIKLNRG